MMTAIAILVFAADRITKIAVKSSMSVGECFELLPFIDIRFVTNTGAAFNIFTDMRIFLIILTSVLIAAVVFYAIKERNRIGRLEKAALALILGGGAGNLADRIIYGYVVDMIDIHILPVFNAADIAVCCGAFLLLISAFVIDRHDADANLDAL